MEAGQKVICVDDVIHKDKVIEASTFYPKWVKKDEIYTIRHIFNNDNIVPGVLLEEIENPEIYIKLIDRIQEPAFGLFRFRTLTKQEMWLEEDKIREEENKNPKPRKQKVEQRELQLEGINV